MQRTRWKPAKYYSVRNDSSNQMNQVTLKSINGLDVDDNLVIHMVLIRFGSEFLLRRQLDLHKQRIAHIFSHTLVQQIKYCNDIDLVCCFRCIAQAAQRQTAAAWVHGSLIELSHCWVCLMSWLKSISSQLRPIVPCIMHIEPQHCCNVSMSCAKSISSCCGRVEVRWVDAFLLQLFCHASMYQ